LAAFCAAWKAAKAAFEVEQKTQPSWVNKNSERCISEAQLRADLEAFVAAEFEAFKGAAKSSLAPAKGLRRSRSQTQASLSALPVVDF
jgi:hypothetical protein